MEYCVRYFLKDFAALFSSSSHFQYLADKDENHGPGHEWKTHSPLFVQSSSSTFKELRGPPFLVSLRQKGNNLCLHL